MDCAPVMARHQLFGDEGRACRQVIMLALRCFESRRQFPITALSVAHYLATELILDCRVVRATIVHCEADCHRHSYPDVCADCALANEQAGG